MREQTALPDTLPNRKRLQKVLERIEAEIAVGIFNYEKTFGKPLAAKAGHAAVNEVKVDSAKSSEGSLFADFANQWYIESEIAWRRSYRVTQRGALDKYLIPQFGQKAISEITKADVLAYRAELSKLQGRSKAGAALSNRRINAIMKPLRQILNEAADRNNFLSPYRNIKPMRVKRTEVVPFTMQEVQTILETVRKDYKNYLTVRFFTGMRTGEANGLKWKYVDFERRLIYIRESIVLGEEDELKTDGSQRDIQMNTVVLQALKNQCEANGQKSEYVFCNLHGKPLDNKNFINRVWNPLLRHLGYEHRKAYQMRHTAATLWLAAGEAPEWIARQLGHTSTEMLFRVYSRYVPNLTRNDGSAIDRLLVNTFAGTPFTSLEEPRKQSHRQSPKAKHAAATDPGTDAQPPPSTSSANATRWQLSA